MITSIPSSYFMLICIAKKQNLLSIKTLKTYALHSCFGKESFLYLDLSNFKLVFLYLIKIIPFSAKLQKEISVKNVRLTPKKFIRMALVLGLYLMLLPICIYHITELGHEEYATRQVCWCFLTFSI